MLINNTTQTTAAEQVRELEKNETTAFLANDYEALNRIWHPNFTVNTPLNLILRTADIQRAMRTGLIRYSLLERHIEEILVHGQVVVTLGHEVTIPIEGSPMAGQKVIRRFTNIWVKEKEQWRMLSRHASNIRNEE